MGVVVAIMFYLLVYLPYIARIYLDWSTYAPNMIPTATAAGVTAVVWCVPCARRVRRLACVAVCSCRCTSAERLPLLIPYSLLSCHVVLLRRCSFASGLWPVYGLLTPAIIAVLTMGLLMSSHFVPVC